MKYELICVLVSEENSIDTDNYKVTLRLRLHPTDNIAPDFFKEIEVISHNSQTGFEVDEQRQQIVTDYITQINL